ncbi:sugar transporter [Pseudorhodobacter turbinis]|uniref:sugar transporter n=1 Tax=Pseudorhodobacter turbinis TaxID=2500533 RepID=UPI001982061A|nr:sugar transporter [Pseudorhodobacter turbinis]
MKKRHYGLILSFIILVLLPMGGVGGYLYQVAKDQYVSKIGFTVRREEAPLVSTLISSLGQVSSASSSDSDILFEFVRSQELVQRIDAQLDLRRLYAVNHDADPVFSLRPGATIEELVDYWQKMVRVSYAPGTGLLELEVRAFDPATVNRIATLIFSESSEMINQLSSIAREDATRYAREDLSKAEIALKNIRATLTRFRLRTQIVDPQAAIQGQMGLLNSLQQQLGEALIEFDLMGQNTRENDPRLTQISSRISAIEARIKQERQQFGQGGNIADGQNYATVVAEFERLIVDREFAEQQYATALASFDRAQTEAQRQSRYLAAYVGPTMAESAEHPRRMLLFLLCAFFATISWAILALVFYSLRDRR